MKRYVNKLKSYSPVVKKRSLHLFMARAEELQRQKEELDKTTKSLQGDVNVLSVRNEEWAKEVRALRLELQRIKEYEKWLSRTYPSQNTLSDERAYSNEYKYRPLISIILPVYNTNPVYLATCLESVINQSYTNWQLCIVDDASNHKPTIDTLKQYAARDPRILLKRRKSNGHISAASNDAIDMAQGEFIGLLDHDDVLWPNALFEVVKVLQKKPDLDFIYSDEDKIESDGNIHFSPYFKPDWSPHLLECVNYITHFSVMRTSLVREVGCFDTGMVGAQDWDLFLRLSEKTSKIYHISTILYSWRAHERSTAASGSIKDYALRSQEQALREHFERTNQPIKNIEFNKQTNYWYPHFEIIGKPLVSIVIPTKDKVDYLIRCIESIWDKTNYTNYEIVIVDTGSKEQSTKDYYRSLKESYNSKLLRIVNWRHAPFNYSDACNFGARHAKGEYLLMLNNDTEILSSKWIESMLGYAQQESVAAVGAKLIYPNKQIQHAGVTIGIGSEEPVAGHIGIFTDLDNHDFITKMYTETVRDSTAVTAACLMVATKIFWEVKGFDPDFRVTFNDVDLCLKFRRAGYLNVYLPYVELLHHESVSIGRVNQVERDMSELNRSAKLMRKRWIKVIDYDPFYNKNFYSMSSNFGLDIHSPLKEK